MGFRGTFPDLLLGRSGTFQGKMMSETAKTPWREDKVRNAGISRGKGADTDDHLIYSEDGLIVAVSIHDAPPNAEANAALIIAAVNAFEPMRKALDDLLNQVIHWGDDSQLEAIAAEIKAAEAALRLAEGEASDT
jgi:hypothetical protein